MPMPPPVVNDMSLNVLDHADGLPIVSHRPGIVTVLVWVLVTSSSRVDLVKFRLGFSNIFAVIRLHKPE